MPRAKRGARGARAAWRPRAKDSVSGSAGIAWELRELLNDGPADLAPRPRPAHAVADVALVLPRGVTEPSTLGLPDELLAALADQRVALRVTAGQDAADARGADVVLAAGWAAAPAVMRLEGVRARAVLATVDPPPLAHLGWTAAMPVLAPPWLGGSLPAAADAVYAPMPVHRREDLVLVHGEDVLALLAVAELLERRPGLSVAVSGVPADLELPFGFLPVEAGASALAHAFASAAVAFAPPLRGWRPAAVAMLACGQPVVAGGPAASELSDAIAFVDSPAAAADQAERLIDDLELRAERVRAGLAPVQGGWAGVARALLAQLDRLERATALE